MTTVQSSFPAPVRYRGRTATTPDRWWTVDCSCRGDGPWTVLGPSWETFMCARCGEQMMVRPA